MLLYRLINNLNESQCKGIRVLTGVQWHVIEIAKTYCDGFEERLAVNRVPEQDPTVILVISYIQDCPYRAVVT